MLYPLAGQSRPWPALLNDLNMSPRSRKHTQRRLLEFPGGGTYIGHSVCYPHRFDAMNDRLPFRATSLGSAYEGLRLPAAVLLDNIRSMYNVGSFFRTSDAVGLETLYLCGITAYPPKSAISKTALGAEDSVAWQHHANACEPLALLRTRGYEIVAIETSLHSVDLYEWRPAFPVCILFGHEVDGIRPELLAMADTHVRIPMIGRKHSLNVATAAGVVLYELLRKYRELDRSR